MAGTGTRGGAGAEITSTKSNCLLSFNLSEAPSKSVLRYFPLKRYYFKYKKCIIYEYLMYKVE